MPKRYNVSAASGTFNTLVAGTVTGGTSISIGNQANKLTNLSALVTVLAETNTLTISAKWQVSKDAVTWVDVVESNNPAVVVLATGTAGADTAVTRAITAPDSVYGWQYARIAVTNGVATGAAADTYALSYCYITA